MRRAIWYALILALVLSVWSSMQGEEDQLLASTGESDAGRRSQAREGLDPSVGRRNGGQSSRASGNVPEAWVKQALFDGVTSWQRRGPLPVLGEAMPMAWASAAPPPVDQPVAMAPAEPIAPPFSYQWVGRFDDEPDLALAAGPSGGSAGPVLPRVVVTRDDATWVVRVGDVIEDQWRIERIQGTSMDVIYLPLGQRQSIEMK